MNERELISLWEKALIILVAVLVSVLFFVLIASGSAAYKELRIQADSAKTEEPITFGGVVGRHIDTEAGVACYVFRGGGGECFLIEDTLLGGGE